MDCEGSNLDSSFLSIGQYLIIPKTGKFPADIKAIQSVSSTYELLAATGPKWEQLIIYKLEYPLKQLMIINDPQMNVYSACFDATGRYIAVGADMYDHSVSIYDITTQQRIAYAQIPECPISKIWWLTNGLYFKDGAGRVYEGDMNLLFKLREYIQNKR